MSSIIPGNPTDQQQYCVYGLTQLMSVSDGQLLMVKVGGAKAEDESKSISESK